MHPQNAPRFLRVNAVHPEARWAENVDMATPLPDPITVPWPRRTAQTVLRPVNRDDATAMHAYRSLPEVCRHLSHGPLTPEQVERRIEGRLSGLDPTPGRLVRGVAIELEGAMVGDAMLRTQRDETGQPEMWIGYALHPVTWGRGLATEVAREPCAIGTDLGLTVRADAYLDNPASHRVLEKAGLTVVGESVEDGRKALLFARVPG